MFISIEKQYVTIECCNCGVIFAVSEKFNKNKHETQDRFWCPNGHPQSYTQSKSDILLKKLRQSEEEISILEVENAKLNKLKRKKKKL